MTKSKKNTGKVWTIYFKKLTAVFLHSVCTSFFICNVIVHRFTVTDIFNNVSNNDIVRFIACFMNQQVISSLSEFKRSHVLRQSKVHLRLECTHKLESYTDYHA